MPFLPVSGPATLWMAFGTAHEAVMGRRFVNHITLLLRDEEKDATQYHSWLVVGFVLFNHHHELPV